MLRITGNLRDHRAKQERSAMQWVEAHWMTNKATEAELQETVDAWMMKHKVAPRAEDIALALYENDHGHPPLVD